MFALRVNARRMQCVAGRQMGLFQAFSTDAPANPFTYPTEQEAYAESRISVIPTASSEILSKSECGPNRPMNRGNGQFNDVPQEILDKLTVRVYRKAKNAMQSTTEPTKCWRLEVDNSERWVNQLMNYSSGSDPMGVTGLRQIRFDTLEAAKLFLEEQGFKYKVEKPYERPDLTGGEKSYGHNFLNYHVSNRRKKWSTKKFASTQFAHPERGTDCWVNLKHTKFGEKASEKVSMTHWSDPHPNKLNAKHWYMNTLQKKQELARKLGK